MVCSCNFRKWFTVLITRVAVDVTLLGRQRNKLSNHNRYSHMVKLTEHRAHIPTPTHTSYMSRAHWLHRTITLHAPNKMHFHIHTHTHTHLFWKHVRPPLKFVRSVKSICTAKFRNCARYGVRAAICFPSILNTRAHKFVVAAAKWFAPKWLPTVDTK